MNPHQKVAVLSAFLVAWSACASKPIPVVSSGSTAELIERNPTSIPKKCIDLFEPSTFQKIVALRERAQTRNAIGMASPKPLSQVITLEQIRLRSLANLKVSLPDAVSDILAISPAVDLETLASFLRLVNTVNTSSSPAAIEKELRRQKSIFYRARNVFTRRTKAPFEGVPVHRRHIMAEYILRNTPALFARYPEELKQSLITDLHLSSEAILFRDVLNQTLPAVDRFRLMRELVDLYASGSNLNGDLDRLSVEWLYRYLESDQALVDQQLRQAFTELPNDVRTRQFAALVTGPNRERLTSVLMIAEDQNLQVKNPSLWFSFLSDSLNQASFNSDTLAVWDRWIQMNSRTDFKSALNLLRLVAHKRKSLQGDGASRQQIYTTLLASASSQAARSLVLEEIAYQGPSALELFVGHGQGAVQRIKMLFAVQLVSSDAQKNLVAYFSSLRSNQATLNDLSQDRNLRAQIWKRFPLLKISHFDSVTEVMTEANSDKSLSILIDVLRDQDQLETSLQRALASVVRANAPPQIFRTLARPWVAYLRAVPASERETQVTSLLAENSASPAALSTFIAKLDPVEGVRQAVTRYLAAHRYTRTNRTDFSTDEIRNMFEGSRFTDFFPHMRQVQLDDTVRTRFLIALRTNPEATGSSANIEWIREKLESTGTSNGVHAGFGFRPALHYDRLNNIAAADFVVDGVTPEHQIAGLIVQGYYEKAGVSIMAPLSRSRGQTDVEFVGPQFTSTMQHSLLNGALSRQSELIQSLFVRNWALNSNGALIATIRNRAIQVAEASPSFWDLRVEIHNFPTMNTLLRTKVYRDGVAATSPVRPALDQLILELEKFFRTSESAQAMSETIREKLSLSDENREKIAIFAKDFDHISELEKLERLIEIRDRFREFKLSQNQTESSKFNLILGDQILSETAMTTFSRWLTEEFPSAEVPTRVWAIQLALGHLHRDHWIRDSELVTWQESLLDIGHLEANSLEQKQRLNEIVSGFIDQIYFHTQDQFGFYDNALFSTFQADHHAAPRFVDATLRSGITFLLSKIVDEQGIEIAHARKVEHRVDGKVVSGLVTVHNAGEAVGTLRINKNPMELSSSEIGVFEQVPAEAGPMAGIITVGVGARLSHLQLLARSLRIPNVQVSRDMINELRPLDGQWVRVRANDDGQLTFERGDGANQLVFGRKRKIKVPEANLSERTPIAFSALKNSVRGSFAGPKGVTLAKLYQSGRFEGEIPDGEILPFGFFDRYAEQTGLKPLLEQLAKVSLKNRHLVGFITAQIEIKIRSTPIPTELLDQVEQSVKDLQARSGHGSGFFYRSDTNVEDLPEFNGAGLNDSVPNVPVERLKIDAAIRQVWISPFKENSIYWRGQALGRSTVTVAQPSVVIMPTVKAKSSGVLVTRGGSNWQSGRGHLSANFGIASVVQAERPVEEYSFDDGRPHLISYSASQTKPVAQDAGGLKDEAVAPGTKVLTLDQAVSLNKLGQNIESTLGSQDRGWDIEWAIDADDHRVVLQARPGF